MMDFNKFKKNKMIVNKSIVKINGKIVSPDDPQVKAMMENVQNSYGNFLGTDFLSKSVTQTSMDETDIEQIQQKFSDFQSMGNQQGFMGAFFNELQQEGLKVIDCKSCGAKNTVIQRAGSICEYCGSGLI